MADEPTLTGADVITLGGYGLGLWWAADGPTWAGLLSILADELDGPVARATGTATAHGSALDWGADVALVPAALARLGRELGVGSMPGLLASPVVLLAQSHLRAQGERPSVGSARALVMLAAMGTQVWNFCAKGRGRKGGGSVGGMRTVLVNPRKTRRSAKRAPVQIVRVNPSRAPARRKTRAPSTRVIMVNPSKRRKMRRNGPPLIMPNPRKRRSYSAIRVRRNGPMNYMQAAKTTLYAGAGAGSAYLLNRYVIGNLFYKNTEHWNSDENRKGVIYRGIVRFGVSMAASMFLPSQFGGPFAAANLYPAVQELAAWFQYRGDQYRGANTSAANDYTQPTHVSGTQASLQEDYEAALDSALFGNGY